MPVQAQIYSVKVAFGRKNSGWLEHHCFDLGLPDIPPVRIVTLTATYAERNDLRQMR